jgi:CRP/FNR family transcriptional regulator, cyclic AMP receptor protein
MMNDWKGIGFFLRLSQQCAQAVDACAWQVTYLAGDPVIWEEDACSALYFVVSGAVEIYRTAVDGREHTLGVISPGQGFNLVPVLRKEAKNPANARCIQDTTLIALGREDAQRLMARYSDLAIALAEEMAARLEMMTRKAGALALESVRQRLAAFLIAEAEKEQSDPDIYWTRDDMARQIGTVRDVIGRNLREMEEEGVLRREKGNIVLLDRARLLEIAQGRDTT